MSKKLQKILDEIKSGKRKNTYDIEITPEEYLSKDENGISFLEHLFKNYISINYKDEEKFKNNVEMGYIYCEYGKSLFSFEFDEEGLFSNINGKLFIEFIAEKGKLSDKIIKTVKNHLEIIDIVISTNNMFYLDYLSQEIIEKLMIKYQNGLYPIEKYLRNEKIYKYLIPLVNDAQKLIEICTKYNKLDWLQKANENVLMFGPNENKTLLHFLINDKNIIPDALTNIHPNIDFINFLRKNNFYEYLKSAYEDVLLLEIEPDKTLLEELLEKGYVPEIKGFISKKETIKILNKFNKLELLNKVMDDILLKSSQEVLNIDDEYNRNLLEYMLDNGYNPLKDFYTIRNQEIIKILYNKGYYNILGEKLNEKGLLMEMEPGVSIIDKLLENGIEVNIDSFNSIELAKKLYEIKRLDLLINGEIETLLNFYDSDNTYFDFILEGIKQKKIKYNLNNFTCSSDLKAKFYILIAKHDMMEYIDELEEEMLLEKYNEKTLLDQLLDLDSNITLNKVLTNDVKSKLKISAILKSRGLEQKNVDVIIDKPNFTEGYLDDVKSTLGIGPLPLEGQFLLEKLERSFMSDGKSDPGLVSALVSGYRDALINNYKINIQELRSLVEIKTKKMDRFFYIKEENSGYFRPSTGSVHCDDSTISTLLHETGHALHYYLSNDKVPEEYNEVLERIRQNPETINKVEGYAKRFNELKRKISLVVEQTYEENFDLYFNESKKEEINNFLNKSKEEQKEELKLLGISEDVLNIILDNVFTQEEYISHQKRIFIKENIEAILRSEFGAYISIGDIIDAIYEGDLHSGVLKNNEGKEIETTYGHGISYYYARSHGFDEMIANFCMIIKSKDSKKVLDLLRDIVGDELYNMLCEFYYNNITNSNETQLENKKIL